MVNNNIVGDNDTDDDIALFRALMEEEQEMENTNVGDTDGYNLDTNDNMVLFRALMEEEKDMDNVNLGDTDGGSFFDNQI